MVVVDLGSRVWGPSQRERALSRLRHQSHGPGEGFKLLGKAVCFGTADQIRGGQLRGEEGRRSPQVRGRCLIGEGKTFFLNSGCSGLVWHGGSEGAREKQRLTGGGENRSYNLISSVSHGPREKPRPRGISKVISSHHLHPLAMKRMDLR